MKNHEFEKWKKAVVHLECATDSKSIDERVGLWRDLQRRHEQGEIGGEELARGFLLGSRDVRFRGTAIFLEDGGRRYLLTARHVLHDEEGAKHDLTDEIRRTEDAPPSFRDFAMSAVQERGMGRIFGVIFLVPSLDMIMARRWRALGEFLMNLGAGVPATAPYTFSEPSLDLAVISLNQRDSHFGDALVSYGYQPLHLVDFEEAPSFEGVQVFSVGYPESMSVLGGREVEPAFWNWSSSRISLPVVVFGRVALLHHALSFFWCDFTNYPGNSGAPVIQDDKIVGIVSAQPFYLDPVVEKNTGKMTDLVARTGVPFALATKAMHIHDLLREQVEKDECAGSSS